MILSGLMRRLGVLGVSIAVLLPASAIADTYYTAVLDGPTAGNTSPATGTATFILNATETEVSYFIEYGGLLGVETVAHIHNAPPGVVGPLFLDLAYGSPKIGIWPVGPFEVAELKAGRANILIHTDLYAVAEIRGDLTFDFVSAVDIPGDGNIPAVLDLRDNFPNPFNPLTTIRFGVARDERVLLDVFDVRGRLVRNLLNETRPAGYHTVAWDGLDNRGARVVSGVYLYRLTAGSYSETKRMLLIK